MKKTLTIDDKAIRFCDHLTGRLGGLWRRVAKRAGHVRSK